MQKCLLLQGGGPTVVINRTLVAIIMALMQSGITRIFGALNGVDGIVSRRFVDLLKLTQQELGLLAATPSAGLGTTRDKPDPKAMFDVIQANGVGILIGIGGQDTAATLLSIKLFADLAGYSLVVIHVVKTIDGDLQENHHTVGFGSAGRYVGKAFAAYNLESAGMPSVILAVVMGRDCGLLTAASAVMRKYEDDGPHIICVPEILCDFDALVDRIQEIYSRLGRCVVAVSEGIRDPTGELWIKRLKKVGDDSHGNAKLSQGNALLANFLQEKTQKKLGIDRVISQVLGHLQRSYDEKSSEDEHDAWGVGTKAAEYALRGLSGSVAIHQVSQGIVEYPLVPLERVAAKTWVMPRHFITPDGYDVTADCLNFIRPLVGELPDYFRIKLPIISSF